MLAEVDLEIWYRPGWTNSNADALSRAPMEEATDHYEREVANISASSTNDQSATEIATLQHGDPNLQPILTYLEKKELPADKKKARRLVMESDRFTIIDGVLYLIDSSRGHRLRMAAPSTTQESLLKENHSGSFAGHFSPKSVYEKLARRYWWEGMYRDVVQHCKACLTCASYRGAGHRNKPPLKPIEVGGPFERVGVDILEMPPTERENRYIVVFVDYLTKWVEAFPTADQTSDNIARLLPCVHAQGGKIIGRVVVVVVLSTKIAISRGLGT